ncbi:glycerate kinase-like isoform X1 [Cyprinus carpio]|uniref:Glycerate kinase n=2 Tax=Cyprinus carpio TaxID=7962 RepID=A0A9Q9Y6P7_CYPCA|nr:glycerate kinase-like isoform X1 [Cyprinus carpio]XP_042614657.1 glycerate kinase-like isoform X1 [Cyprinus carpio]XP_042614658.1 glycerate kinase-like isoform X1 [Cyprinus carpio]
MAQIIALSRFLHLQHPLRVSLASLCSRSMSSLDTRARAVFSAAVEGVQPDIVVHMSLERHGDKLLVGGQSFTLTNNLYLVGFGKAVLGMAAEVERIVGDHLIKGVISVPHGIQKTLHNHGKENMLLENNSRITVMEGAKNNLPDADAQKSAECIRELASGLTEKDLLLVLISGGGSALLPAPAPPMSLQEKQDVTRKLAAAGATIQELNTVRRALSLLKGGSLAQCAKPAQVVALILSDVIGDPLDLIASGPTVRSDFKPEEVWAILDRYKLSYSLPSSMNEVLSKARPHYGSQVQEQPEEVQDHVLNVVIGSNTIALECASRKAVELGLRPIILSPGVCGDVHSVARLYGLLSRFACFPEKETPPELAAEILQLGPEVGVESWDLCRTINMLVEERKEDWGVTCLLAGGEPTVQLTGKGRGGRNQELALRVGLELSSDEVKSGAVFLSGGTDGQDGPTEAAGALTDGELMKEAMSQGLDIDGFLTNNDSFTFFSQLSEGQWLLKPGLTGTNVMDVHAMLLPPSPQRDFQ